MPVEQEGLIPESELRKIAPELHGAKCSECKLYETCNKPQMKVDGMGMKKAMIIGEAPGKDEDEDAIGRPFIGTAGEHLEKSIKALGFNFRKDFFISNAVRCRPPNNDLKAHPKAMKLCNPLMWQDIEDYDPSLVILVGTTALQAFLINTSFKDKSIGDWINVAIPYRGRWYVPILHPSYVLRKGKTDLLKSTFDRSLAFALSYVGKPRPFKYNPYHHITIYTKYEEIMALLAKVKKDKPKKLMIDYETTAVKPYHDEERRVQKILCVSLCYDAQMAHAFPLLYPKALTDDQVIKVAEAFTDIMADPETEIMSHNLTMEWSWTKRILEMEPPNFRYCTMTSAHIMDSRRGRSALKVLAFSNWGIEEYDKDIKPFKSGRPFNRMSRVPLPKLLMYCAIDSLVGYKEYLRQEKFFDHEEHEQMRDARDFFMESVKNLAEVHYTGVYMDKPYYVDVDSKLEKDLFSLEATIQASEEVLKFKRMYLTDTFKPKSNEDLRKLVYEVMGFEIKKTTKKEGGVGSTDEEVLSEIPNETIKQILRFKKIDKIKNTFVAQFLREIDPDSRMRPFFPLNTVTTFRGSSSDPNFQNIPKHDKEAKEIIRKGIKPSPGNTILDWDYGAMEVRILACYSRDKLLVDYILNPTTDMHRDESCGVYKLTKEQVTKPIRQVVKNNFVFPMFYRSFHGNCARALWKEGKKLKLESGVSIYKHLHEVGVTSLVSADYDYFEFIEQYDKMFWNRFSGVREWQERSIADFMQFGFLEQFFGFRIEGDLDERKICNYRIQGTAFHCLLWSLNHIKAELKRRNLRTKIIGQIHDNCLYDLYPPEREEVIALTEHYAVKAIQEVHPWMIVPLLVEWDETEVDGSWSIKEEKEDEYRGDSPDANGEDNS